MIDALRSEWTKLRTTPGISWLLVAVIALTVGLGIAVAAAQTVAGGSADTTKISLIGVDLGQAVLAALGVLVVATEYTHGLIRVTLAATPRRLTVLAAKAALLLGAALPVAALAVLGSVLGGGAVLSGHGLDPAHGYALVTLAAPATVRAAIGAALYLVLIALIGFGVATIVRDSALAIGLVLGLLYMVPIVTAVIPDRTLARHIEQLAPMSAGSDVMSTVGLHGLPLSPWQGLGVVALWALAAVAAGGLLWRFRDA